MTKATSVGHRQVAPAPQDVSEDIKPVSARRAPAAQNIQATTPPFKWTPQDDLILKDGVLRSASFSKLARSLRFSAKFTPYDLEHRWGQLLYDPDISGSSCRAMAALAAAKSGHHAHQWSWQDAEEDLAVSESSEQTPADARGGRAIRDAAGGNNAHMCGPTDHDKTGVGYDPVELAAAAHHNEGILAISQRYNPEMYDRYYYQQQRLDCVPENVQAGYLPPWLFGNSSDCIAVLRGQTLFGLTGKADVMIGRGRGLCDIDLSGEVGVVAKISRQQAILSYHPRSGRFSLKNIGKARFFVDDKAIAKDTPVYLPDHCTLSFNEIKMIFQMNPAGTGCGVGWGKRAANASPRKVPPSSEDAAV